MELIIRLKRCCEKKEETIREQAGLSSAEYNCLQTIPARGDVTSKALAQKMGVSASRGSRIVDALVKKGLLARSVSSQDRRASTITLTNRGGDIKLEVEKCLVRCDRALRAKLSAEELEVTVRGLFYATRAIEESR